MGQILDWFCCQKKEKKKAFVGSLLQELETNLPFPEHEDTVSMFKTHKVYRGSTSPEDLSTSALRALKLVNMFFTMKLYLDT